jgi:hypothetical protein
MVATTIYKATIAKSAAAFMIMSAQPAWQMDLLVIHVSDARLGYKIIIRTF